MAKSLIEFSFENEAAFAASLSKAASKISDFRIPMRLIADDFYKSEQAIFQLKSRGGWPDLADSTKKFKRKKGSIYPILRGETGKLERSLTKRGAEGNITNITKTSGEFGSRVKYVGFHQHGTKFMPARPPVFIGPESRVFAPLDQKNRGGRLTRWTRIIEVYTARVLRAS